MLKFQCSHCGGRLALQERHLGRLVHCPECNGITHPMAGEILARQKVKEKVECENCGQPLGKLQRPRRWHQSTVCASCYRALNLEDEGSEEILTARRMLPGDHRGVLVASPRINKPARLSRLLPSVHPRQAESVVQESGGETAHDLRTIINHLAGGMILCGAALLVLMYVLRTIGSLLLWSAGAAVVILACVLISRAYFALKRRMSSAAQESTGTKIFGRSIIKGVLESQSA